MKIAVPTRDNKVDDHFGHCDEYTVFTVGENNSIDKVEMLPSPQGCGCKSNISVLLKNMGVKIMLAGNMGNGALDTLNNQGIDVYRGCSGDVQLLAQQFLKGELLDSGESCHHHEDGHVCHHDE